MKAKSLEIIRDTARFDALEEDWKGIASDRVRGNPFLSHAWNSVCARRISPREELFTLVLRDGQGRAMGIAPLAIESAKAGSVAFRRLCFIGEGFSDYHDLIVRGDDPELCRDMWQAIRSTSTSWDLAQLSELPPESPALAPKGRSILPGRAVLRASCSPKLKLAGTWEEVCQRLPARLVKDNIYQERRLERMGTLVYREVAIKEEVPPFMAELFRLHEARWAGTTTPSKYLKLEARSRAEELALAMFDSGYASYGSLTVAGRTIAAHFGFSSTGARYYYVPAYDLEYDKYSIGRVLYFRTLKAALDSGAKVFDFLRGSEDYKLRWGGTEDWNLEVKLFRPTPGCAAARAAAFYRRHRSRT